MITITIIIIIIIIIITISLLEASRPPTLAIATCTSGTAETLFSAQAA